MFQAIENYQAKEYDEINAVKGDMIIIHERYDDGWALCTNLNSNQDGVLPLAIVTE
jgi:hypothetical protein